MHHTTSTIQHRIYLQPARLLALPFVARLLLLLGHVHTSTAELQVHLSTSIATPLNNNVTYICSCPKMLVVLFNTSVLLLLYICMIHP